ncbi:hypothetical protein C8J57DRAFT_1727722 [Mycena rebaudengoi]|nr:hypothetical protein C8J57DRAFT_1727722 [Mycena rebaudengoi]
MLCVAAPLACARRNYPIQLTPQMEALPTLGERRNVDEEATHKRSALVRAIATPGCARWRRLESALLAAASVWMEELEPAPSNLVLAVPNLRGTVMQNLPCDVGILKCCGPDGGRGGKLLTTCAPPPYHAQVANAIAVNPVALSRSATPPSRANKRDADSVAAQNPGLALGMHYTTTRWMTAHVERPRLFFLLFLFHGPCLASLPSRRAHSLTLGDIIPSVYAAAVGRWIPACRGTGPPTRRACGGLPYGSAQSACDTARRTSAECPSVNGYRSPALQYAHWPRDRTLLLAASTTFSFQSVAPPPLPFTSSIALHRFILW